MLEKLNLIGLALMLKLRILLVYLSTCMSNHKIMYVQCFELAERMVTHINLHVYYSF